MITPFDYRRAETAQDAAALLAGQGTALAGGTDLLPLLKCEVRAPELLVDLRALPELRGIGMEGDRLRIGAMTTLAEIEASDLVRERLPALAYAARCVASPQIRAMGTLGGNILQDRRCLYFNQSAAWRRSLAPCFKTGGAVCHQAPASPICRAPYYSDVAPVLTACGAVASVISPQGEHTVTVEELCGAHGKRNGGTARGNELVTAFLLPLEAANGYLGFVKESVRSSLDFPVFNASLLARQEQGEWFVRLFAGAVAPAPLRLPDTETLLSRQLEQGRPSREAVVESALAELRKGAVLVRETSITMASKRGAFRAVGRLVDELAAQASE